MIRYEEAVVEGLPQCSPYYVPVGLAEVPLGACNTNQEGHDHLPIYPCNGGIQCQGTPVLACLLSGPENGLTFKVYRFALRQVHIILWAFCRLPLMERTVLSMTCSTCKRYVPGSCSYSLCKHHRRLKCGSQLLGKPKLFYVKGYGRLPLGHGTWQRGTLAALAI
jgi:hypothetical protein